MTYTIFIERYAQKQIMKLDKKTIPLFKSAISELAENPRKRGCIKLKEKRPTALKLGIIELYMRLMIKKSQL